MTVGEPLIGIAGSGIARLRAAKALLTYKADARIVIFGEETHRTYNRPGLTKKRYPSPKTSGMAIAEELKVTGAESSVPIWRLDTRVESADLHDKVLHLGTGETFEYDSLVIATGVRSRTSARGGRECEIHAHRTLRGLDDAQYVHHKLRTGKKVTIVGAGFVACELASLAKEYGCDVVVLETRRCGPLERLLGERIASALGRWVTHNGTTFLTGDAARKQLCNGDSTASDLEAPVGSAPLHRSDRQCSQRGVAARKRSGSLGRGARR